MVPFIPVSRPLPLCTSVEISTCPSLRIMRFPLPDLFRLSQTAFVLSGYESIYLIYVGTCNIYQSEYQSEGYIKNEKPNTETTLLIRNLKNSENNPLRL